MVWRSGMQRALRLCRKSSRIWNSTVAYIKCILSVEHFAYVWCTQNSVNKHSKQNPLRTAQLS
jgi:hypothetical protein